MKLINQLNNKINSLESEVISYKNLNLIIRFNKYNKWKKQNAIFQFKWQKGINPPILKFNLS